MKKEGNAARYFFAVSFPLFFGRRLGFSFFFFSNSNRKTQKESPRFSAVPPSLFVPLAPQDERARDEDGRGVGWPAGESLRERTGAPIG